MLLVSFSLKNFRKEMNSAVHKQNLIKETYKTALLSAKVRQGIENEVHTAYEYLEGKRVGNNKLI